VGTFAVQIAKSFGAEVTGVCSSRNVELVRSIGADRVVDYGREDFTSDEGRYDLLLDLVGNRPLSECRRALGPEGILVVAAGPPSRLLRAAVTGGARTTSYVSRPNRKDLESLRDLLENGRVEPVIDRIHPLREVPDALRYLGEGHTRGKVVISV
jgi:NADPH:quinone reductase-like Zn-dependent oxidoreductase